MNFNSLTAISPIDGRYREKTNELSNFFSEFALIKYRVKVEIEYFIALCEISLPQLEDVDASLFSQLRDIYENFTEVEAQKIKDIEKVTNHDVKAVEYFLKEKFDDLNLRHCKTFVYLIHHYMTLVSRYFHTIVVYYRSYNFFDCNYFLYFPYPSTNFFVPDFCLHKTTEGEDYLR